jgi:hypothetical protein
VIVFVFVENWEKGTAEESCSWGAGERPGSWNVRVAIVFVDVTLS